MQRGSATPRIETLHRLLRPVWRVLRDHSLSIFLLISGLGWVALYARIDSEAKWGQVVGNTVSEWTQIFGLVLLTKRPIERHQTKARNEAYHRQRGRAQVAGGPRYAATR